MKMKWLLQIRRPKWTPTGHSVVCSEHFKDNFFLSAPDERTRLSREAFPTIFNLENLSGDEEENEGGPDEDDEEEVVIKMVSVLQFLNLKRYFSNYTRWVN